MLCWFYESYVHRPIAPCTILHEALAGHLELAWQMSAQRLGFDEPGVSRQHSGCAVVPAGTSVGHGPEATASRGGGFLMRRRPAELIKYTQK